MTARRSTSKGTLPPAGRQVFPFTAIVGQEEMKLALLLNVIAPSVGGVFITGHRGTGKSTAVRALAQLLPPIKAAQDCAFNCDPSDEDALCEECRALLKQGAKMRAARRAVPVVELPLGATEDRVCGTIDLTRAVRDGVRAFEPGLLARANRGFLYIDEVNLLADHLVDLLLDVAAAGRNRVEREGVSTEHPARFVLVGSSNPEEGELRPQLLDRFGLCAEVSTVEDIDSRVLIVERREAFERDPAHFAGVMKDEQETLRRCLSRARKNYEQVSLPRQLLRSIAELCARLKVDGHRGELTIARAARALAALEGRKEATAEDVRRVAPMSLRHRLRRDPLEQMSGGGRIEESVEELFGDTRNSTAEGKSKAAADRNAESSPSSEDAGSDGCGPSSTNKPGHKGERRDTNQQTNTAVLPPVATNPSDDFVHAKELPLNRSKPPSTASRRASVRKTSLSTRGRYAGASPSSSTSKSLALDATLHAAALSNLNGQGTPSTRTVHIKASDLRFKRFRDKAGTLFIFAVDTSGSMALNRIGQAKGALAHLLRRSYVRRDRVALVSFRDGAAEILLSQSRAPSRARRILEALPCGGATPLAAGLLRALEVAKSIKGGEATRVVLVLFTDGRANQSLAESKTAGRGERALFIRREIDELGAALRGAGVSSVVVDTQSRFTSGGEGRTLAAALGGRYVQLPQTTSTVEFENALKGVNV